MIVDKVDRPLVIDLTGPAGNAFSLLAFAIKNARKFNLDASVVMEEMKSGDYDYPDLESIVPGTTIDALFKIIC